MKIRHTLWYWSCLFKEWFRHHWHTKVCMKDEGIWFGDKLYPTPWTHLRVWVCEPFDTFVMTNRKWHRFQEMRWRREKKNL